MANARQFERRLRASAERDEWKRIGKGIEKLQELAAQGEKWAIELIRDTLDGKPKQESALEITDNNVKSGPMDDFAQFLNGTLPTETEDKTITH